MKRGKSESDTLKIPIRQIVIYILVLWNPDTLTPRVFAYNNSQECLDAFLLYKDTSFYPETFSRKLYVAQGHPLYNIADEIPDLHYRKSFKL